MRFELLPFLPNIEELSLFCRETKEWGAEIVEEQNMLPEGQQDSCLLLEDRLR